MPRVYSITRILSPGPDPSIRRDMIVVAQDIINRIEQINILEWLAQKQEAVRRRRRQFIGVGGHDNDRNMLGGRIGVELLADLVAG